MVSLDTIGGNDRADEIAKSLGYRNAEELKADYVGKSAISRYDIKYDKATKELVLVHKSTGATEYTGLRVRI